MFFTFCDGTELPPSPNKLLSLEIIDTCIHFISVTPVVTVDCPGNITLNQSDNFKCLCTGQDGNPRANVTWYGDNVLVATGIEEAILNLTNVTKNDDGTYTCVAKSHEEAKNVTKIKVTVHCKYNYSTDGITVFEYLRPEYYCM